MKLEKFRLSGSPLWPALLSALVIPGAGQLANREIPKGLLLIFASIGSFIWFSRTITERLGLLLPGTPDQWLKDQTTMREAILKLVQETPQMFLTFQILIILVWGFGVADAYLTARKRPRSTNIDASQENDINS